MGQRGDGRTHCVLLQVVPPSALDQLLPQMLLEPDKKKKRGREMRHARGRAAGALRAQGKRALGRTDRIRRSAQASSGSSSSTPGSRSWSSRARRQQQHSKQRRRKANAPERAAFTHLVVAKDVFSPQVRVTGLKRPSERPSLPKRLLASRDASRTSASTASPTGRPSKQPCSPF